MTESDLTRKVMKMLKTDFPHAYCLKVNDRFTSGVPDILICLKGHFWAIELKIGLNEPTPLQRYTLNKINTAGGTAAVCKSVAEVKNLLTSLN